METIKGVLGLVVLVLLGMFIWNTFVGTPDSVYEGDNIGCTAYGDCY